RGRCDDSAQSEAEIRIAHSASTIGTKPLGYEDLIGNGTGEGIAQDNQDAQRLVLPQAGDTTHEDERDANESGADENNAPCANAVDDRSCEQPKRDSGNKKSNQEALCHLRARKS